ncbi:MAG: hypothetical protein D6727_10030 [Gammaproteobacteria bacterium]|nr:MAG: hypothetical protein D6727_10030 [Gammaproteobacteria bacterium]
MTESKRETTARVISLGRHGFAAVPDQKTRAAFCAQAEQKLQQARLRSELVTARIAQWVKRGRIAPSEQLVKAVQRMDQDFGRADASLERLRSASEDDWQLRRRDWELALDDFTQAIKEAVGRFP